MTNGAITAIQGRSLDQIARSALRGAAIGFVSGIGGYGFQALGYSSTLGGLIFGGGESAAEAYFSGEGDVLRAALFGGAFGGALGHLGPRIFNRLFGRVIDDVTVDLFSAIRSRNLTQLTTGEVGDLSESIARTLLGENGFTDIIAVKNASGNGIDLIARTSDGILSFFEVKASRIGQIGSLSARQQNLPAFIEDVLGQASTGTGRYRSISAELQDRASELLREFRRDPLKVGGTVIGVDLLNEVIRVSPWR